MPPVLSVEVSQIIKKRKREKKSSMETIRRNIKHYGYNLRVIRKNYL